jgi:hypothetical protein
MLDYWVQTASKTCGALYRNKVHCCSVKTLTCAFRHLVGSCRKHYIQSYMAAQKQGLVAEWKHQGKPSFQSLENVAMLVNVPVMLKIGDCEVSD